MCSRPFETRSLPTLAHCFPRSFTFLSLIPSTLSLPLSRPHGFSLLRCVLRARCIRSFETRSLPTLAHCFHRSLTFYVAHPIDSFAPALSPSRVCPSMSRLPSTLHSLH